MNALDGNNDDPENRRSERRARTLKRGRVVFNAGYGTFECVVKDMSSSGARLQFGDALGVPQHFELIIDSDKIRKACTVRWRHNGMVGVSFDPAT